MGKKFAAMGLATAVAIGGLGVAALNPLGVAGAQNDPAIEAPTNGGGRQGPLARALDKLVADGTLTQAQADAVADATAGEATAAREERRDRRSARHQELLSVVADALGATPDDVKAALAGGTSIAAQAEAAGVERQVVDDALTALLTERIETARSEGRITDEQAAKATERLDRVVARILDADGHGGRHGHGFGPRGRAGGN